MFFLFWTYSHPLFNSLFFWASATERPKSPPRASLVESTGPQPVNTRCRFGVVKKDDDVRIVVFFPRKKTRYLSEVKKKNHQMILGCQTTLWHCCRRCDFMAWHDFIVYYLASILQCPRRLMWFSSYVDTAFDRPAISCARPKALGTVGPESISSGSTNKDLHAPICIYTFESKWWHP